MPTTEKIPTRSGPIDKVSLLRQHPLFRDLTPAALERLCRYAKTVKFKRGAKVVSKGDPGASMFAVARGTVRMSSPSTDGRNALLNLIGAGETFGEIAMLDGQPRSTDAIANTDCELLVIDRRDLLPFLREEPDLAMRFIELLCTRLRWTSEQVEELILHNLSARLASALVRLVGRKAGNGTDRTIDATQQQLSEMVGISRESTNKQLVAWAANGWVRLEHGAIVVLKPDALREVAEREDDDDD
jgi:CRP/FNR family transcriptional regulator, cyclic AMP receptor protein